MLEKFSSSKQFIFWVVKNLNEGNAQEAGKAFEEYTRKWHKAFSDYLHVFDANNIHDIPSVYLDKLDAWDLLNKGANSFGIDKVCVTRHHEIDVHQDKSTLHTDKNLSAKKAEGMMSLRNNPLKNIRHFVVNTTAQDLSHYKNVWKDQTPITFGYDAFVPDDGDVEAIERDKQFWKNIKAEAKGKPTVNIYAFKSRGPEQDAYIQSGVDFARRHLAKDGYAKWHQLGVGALGKSVLDPVMLAELENEFDKAYTNTPQPVSINWFHSSKTLPKNGWEAVQRRRAKGIYDEVIVISGTEVIDSESDDNINSRFDKTTSVSTAVVKIKQALDNGKSVLLLALYHHAKQVAEVKTQLDKYYPGFRFWYRNRDECDWPCSNVDSSFAPALDDRTDSVLTFGSSGTQRLGKDPVNDYGLNNIQIHGPCVHNFTWAQAEDAGLVKPLMLIMPSIKESEVANLFPEFVNKDGRVDWNMRVNGVAVDNEMPTAKLIADLVCFARALAEYPEIKRVLTFSHFVKTNKLAEMNFPWVVDKVLGKSNLARNAKKMFFQVLNDDKYNSNSVGKNHNAAIKQAKAHDRYAIGSSKVFSRGYDDQFSPKHHAAIHWDEKNIVTTAQEIWRVIRKDTNKQGQPVCGDPNAYYILPQIYNDLDDTPTWSEERLRTLQGILQFNKNIFDEFQSIVQTPSSKRKRKTQEKGSRFWIPGEFDVEAFGGLVTFVARNSKGDLFISNIAEAHTWLLEKYLEIENITNNNSKGIINNAFLEQEKFKPVFEIYSKDIQKNKRSWVQRFWSIGWKYPEEIKSVMESNKIEFELFKQKQLQHREVLKQKVIDDSLKALASQIDDVDSHRLDSIIREKYNLTNDTYHAFVKDAKKKWRSQNKGHFKNNQRKIAEMILDYEYNDDILSKTYFENIFNKLNDIGISTSRISTGMIKNHFIVSDKFKVFTKQEKDIINQRYKQIKQSNATRHPKENYIGLGGKKVQTPYSIFNTGSEVNCYLKKNNIKGNVYDKIKSHPDEWYYIED